MNRFFTISVFYIFSVFPFYSFAADYFWYTGDIHYSQHFTSPVVACQSSTPAPTADTRYVYKSVTINQSYGTCFLEKFTKSGWPPYDESSSGVLGFINIYRSGDSCPTPSVYNAQNGECEGPAPDPCKDTTGSIDHEHQVGNLDGTGSRSEPPSSICNKSCQYSFNFQTVACYRFADGTHQNGAFCKYKYKGNGTSCTAGPDTPPGSVFDQPPTKLPVPLDPTLTKDIQCTDWSTNADGTGSRTCNNVSEYKDPGKLDCSTGTGQLVCHPATPSPAYTKTDVTETTTTKTNADGSKDNTTTKKTDKTNCYGAKPCTSTSATEVKTDGTNPDGTANDNANGSTCTGTGCKDVGKDSSNSDPSKDPEETEEEPRIATGGGSCDAAPACSGDAIDCAVLAEQRKARCDTEEARNFPKHKAEIEGLLTGSKFQASADEEITAESFVNSGARFLPATCPVDSSFSLSFAGGHTFALSYSPFCFFAESLAPLIVIAATVFAALYVGRAFGGE